MMLYLAMGTDGVWPNNHCRWPDILSPVIIMIVLTFFLVLFGLVQAIRRLMGAFLGLMVWQLCAHRRPCASAVRGALTG